MTRHIPLLPTLLVAAAATTMVGFGIWQLQRREWKEDLIARYTQAQARSANVPWPRDNAAMEQSLFRWSQFDCQRVLGIRSGAGTSAAGQKGWAHIARCALDGGGEAEVALGWSSAPQPPQWSGGPVSGIIGPGGSLGGVLHASMPPADLQPLAAPDPQDLPNNHLAYAGQWFFFALTAVLIYLLALRKKWRGE